MNSDHIVKSFDDELMQLRAYIAEMGGLVESLLAESTDALIKRNIDIADEIISKDKFIDDLEVLVNEQVIKIISLRQPMALDLRNTVSALKISNDLERMGDYAANIAKRSKNLFTSPVLEASLTIGRMSSLVQKMIKNVLDAYASNDTVLAQEVIESDLEVDLMHTSLFRELITYMMEDAKNISSSTHLFFIAKNIERIGDHATNIAESIIYAVDGISPQGIRQKGDSASNVE